MQIYSPTHELIYSGYVGDQSYRYKSIMGDNTLTVYLSTPDYMEIPIGSYVYFQRDATTDGEYYYLLRPQNLTKIHTQNWEYVILLESQQYLLRTRRFKFFTINTEEAPDKPYKTTGSYTATVHEWLTMLVRNMNDGDSGWTIGSYIETERKLLSYSGENCFEFLQKIADEFKTEWSVIGKQISIGKVERQPDSPIPLSYGFGNGLKSGVKRDIGDTDRINRILVLGGDRNVFRSKYGSSTLLLPKNYRIKYDGTRFEGEDGYNEALAVEYVTDAHGMYVERTDKDPNELLSEDIYENKDIYPMRAGMVSYVIAVDDSKALYDIIDENNTVDYNDYWADQEKPVVAFHTGILTGKEFEIHSYNHTTKKFELVPITDADVEMPKGVFIPAVGDKYAVFNIYVPEQYIQDAELRFLKETVRVFHEASMQKFIITCELSSIYSTQNWAEIGNKLDVGYFVNFNDPQFFTEPQMIRIVGVKDYINKPKKPTLELSNEVRVNSWSSMKADIRDSETNIDRVNNQNMAQTKRMWRDVEQTMQSMYDPDGDLFTQFIQPLYVQTMQLVAGTKSLQFEFLDRVNHSIKSDLPTPSYNPSDKSLNILPRALKHLTLGIDDITPESNREYLIWDIDTETLILDPSKPYYIYAKCEKSGTVGEYIASLVPIETEQVTGYYHFWVGLSNSEYDNQRSWRSMYGFTEILPGQITTDRIVSANGKTYFDLANNRLQISSSGSSVVSPSGDSSVIEVDRGGYNSTKTYFVGDKVWYSGIAYVCISNAASTGTPDKDTSKWKPYSEKVEIGGVNLIVRNNEIADYMVSPDGQIGVSKTSSLMKDFIPVVAGETYIFSQIKAADQADHNFRYAFYQEDKETVIIRKFNVNNEFKETVPDGAAFLRVSYPTKNKVQLEKGTKATSWSPAPEDVQSEISKANESANNAALAANQAKESIVNLNSYVDGAFKDGVVDEAEAKAIEKYLNTIDESMAELETTYNKLYVNPYLLGSAKTNLLNAKINLFGARDNLKKAINDAIADGKTTDAEKKNVDDKFALFNDAVKDFNNAVQDANKAIQSRLDSLSSEKIDSLEIGAANLLNDSSFEFGVGGSSSVNGSSVERVVNHGYEGSYAMKCTTTSHAASGYSWEGMPTVAGRKYVASCYVRADTPVWECEFGIYTSSWQWVKNKVISIGTDWTRIDIPFTATAKDMRIVIIKANAIFYIDCVQLEDGNKLTSYKKSLSDVEYEIDKVQAEIDDIANDNKLTQNEKQTISREMAIIRSEKPIIDAQSDKVKISRTSYDKAYTELDTYITPLLSNLTTTSNINGSEFRTFFQNYYNEKVTLLKNISNFLKEDIDNIHVGGVNLIDNSQGIQSVGGNGSSTGEAIVNTSLFALLTEGETYTFQCKVDGVWGASNSTDTVEVFLLKDWSTASGNYVRMASNPYTFKAPKTGKFYIRIDSNKGDVKHNFWEFQIEKGNKATDWRPSNNDTQKQIDEAKAQAEALGYLKTALAGSTTSEGGLLLTSMIQLGIIDKDKFIEKAGINGTAKNNNDVIAWFGGTLQQAIQNLAAIVFKADGSAMFGKGAHKFNTDGSLSFANGNFLYDLINGLAITGKFESNKSGNRIIIDPDTRTFKMLSKDGFEVFNLSFSEGIGSDGKPYIIPRFIMNRYSDGKIKASIQLDGQSMRISNADTWFFIVDAINEKININYNMLKPRNECHPFEVFVDGETLKVRKP